MIFKGGGDWNYSLCFCGHHTYFFSVNCPFPFSLLPAQSLFYPCCKVICDLVHLPSIWNTGHKGTTALLWKRAVKIDSTPTPRPCACLSSAVLGARFFLSFQRKSKKQTQTNPNQSNKTPKQINKNKPKQTKKQTNRKRSKETLE